MFREQRWLDALMFGLVCAVVFAACRPEAEVQQGGQVPQAEQEPDSVVDFGLLTRGEPDVCTGMVPNPPRTASVEVSEQGGYNRIIPVQFSGEGRSHLLIVRGSPGENRRVTMTERDNGNGVDIVAEPAYPNERWGIIFLDTVGCVPSSTLPSPAMPAQVAKLVDGVPRMMDVHPDAPGRLRAGRTRGESSYILARPK